MSNEQASSPMRTVDALTPADRSTVWRCTDCTMKWFDNVKRVATRTGTTLIGAWCRLDYHTWTVLESMPSGPFYDLGEHPDFSDYRDNPILANFHSNVRP